MADLAMGPAVAPPVHALFADLLALPVQSAGKPSLAENLLDVLEICAVAAGLKACHLQGDGHRDPERMDALQAIAHRHQLRTRRTPRCRPEWSPDASATQTSPTGTGPRLPSGLLEPLQRLGDAKRLQAPDVLWIYRDPATSDPIDAAVAGQGLGALLGYPRCCADAHSALAQSWLAAHVAALQAQHQPATQEALLHLLATDAPVDPAHLSPPVLDAAEPSAARLPFVSFDACAACQAQPDSPAAGVHAPLQAFAFALSRPFALHLWQAQLAESGAPPDADTPCPCGSSQGVVRCCWPGEDGHTAQAAAHTTRTALATGARATPDPGLDAPAALGSSLGPP